MNFSDQNIIVFIDFAGATTAFIFDVVLKPPSFLFEMIWHVTQCRIAKESANSIYPILSILYSCFFCISTLPFTHTHTHTVISLDCVRWWSISFVYVLVHVFFRRYVCKWYLSVYLLGLCSREGFGCAVFLLLFSISVQFCSHL